MILCGNNGDDGRATSSDNNICFIQQSLLSAQPVSVHWWFDEFVAYLAILWMKLYTRQLRIESRQGTLRHASIVFVRTARFIISCDMILMQMQGRILQITRTNQMETWCRPGKSWGTPSYIIIYPGYMLPYTCLTTYKKCLMNLFYKKARINLYSHLPMDMLSVLSLSFLQTITKSGYSGLHFNM